MEFSWVGDASWYGGVIAGYRYGWDLVDPSDPNDPGWTTSGYELGLTAAPPQNLSLGTHTLHIMVIDEQGIVESGGVHSGGLYPRAERRFELESPEVGLRVRALTIS